MDYPNFYDRDLRRLFSDAPEFADAITAAQFINRIRRSVRRVVSGWTGIYQYTIDQVLEDMIERCRELKLRLAVPEDQARQEFTGAAHRAGDELSAQRRPPPVPVSASPVKKLRILALVHDHLVPPEDTTGIDILEAEWKMEYDVIETLREMGHEVRVLGINDNLGGIRPMAGLFKPHIVFNLMEAFAGIPDLRPERRQLSRAAATALHRMQPARADPRPRQGAVEEAARLSPDSGAGIHRRAARTKADAAQAPRLPADRQVGVLRGVGRHLSGVGRRERGAAGAPGDVHPRHARHRGDRRAVHRRPRDLRRA